MERPTKQIEPSFILPIIEQKSKRTGSLILFLIKMGGFYKSTPSSKLVNAKVLT